MDERDSWGSRANGERKGYGFYGKVPLAYADGGTGIMTEVGISMTPDGLQFPALYKNMPYHEFMMLKRAMETNSRIPQIIYDHAYEAAINRVRQGLPAFATPEEEASPMAIPTLPSRGQLTNAQLREHLKDPNVQLFLDYIAKMEGGTYDSRTGGDLSKHPNKVWEFTQTDGKKSKSTAAGRYQFLYKTWKGLADAHNITDFSEESQDMMAVQLLSDCGALEQIVQGKFLNAVQKAGSKWMSFPSSTQPQRKKTWRDAYEFFGIPYSQEQAERLAKIKWKPKTKNKPGRWYYDENATVPDKEWPRSSIEEQVNKWDENRKSWSRPYDIVISPDDVMTGNEEVDNRLAVHDRNVRAMATITNPDWIKNNFQTPEQNLQQQSAGEGFNATGYQDIMQPDIQPLYTPGQPDNTQTLGSLWGVGQQPMDMASLFPDDAPFLAQENPDYTALDSEQRNKAVADWMGDSVASSMPVPDGMAKSLRGMVYDGNKA